MSDHHDLPMEEYHRAGLEITKGNPDVYKSLWSRRDDVTLANPFGAPVRGWGRGIGQAGSRGEQLSRRPRLRVREHLDGGYARACVYRRDRTHSDACGRL